MVKQKKLHIPTYNEIKEKIRNHQLWLKGDSNDKKGIFADLDLVTPAHKIYEEIDENFNKKEDRKFYDIFVGNDLQNSEFTNSNLANFSFRNANLTNCNFKNSDIRWCSFTNAIVKNTDFRGSNFEFKQFSKQQQEEAIFTDSQYEQYISKLESKNILQEKTLENINEEKTEKLVSGFEKLQKEFAKEERLWLVLSYMSFFTIFGLSITLIIDLFIPSLTGFTFLYIFSSIVILAIFIPYLFLLKDIDDKGNYKKITLNKFSFKKIGILIGEFILTYPDKKILKRYIFIGFLIIFYLVLNLKIEELRKNLPIQTDSIFNFSNPYYSLLPLSIILFSFLYFSIYQYSKAKNLRIENQNKVTLLYGFEAIKTDTTPNINKGRFYDKIADEVFKGVFEEKNTGGNLPIDKVIDIITTSLKK